MGRVATSLSPSRAMPVESAESPAPSRAASRAMNSRCRVVTGAKMTCGDSLPARSATTGVHTSARYGAKAAFSSSQIRLAPHSPSCLIPSGVALSVTHTASACAPACPARRDASPSTSAITFLGAPCQSSSTMHQYAPGMSDPFSLCACFSRLLLQALQLRGPRHGPRTPPGRGHSVYFCKRFSGGGLDMAPALPPAADIPFTSASASAAGASTWPPHSPRPRTSRLLLQALQLRGPRHGPRTPPGRGHPVYFCTLFSCGGLDMAPALPPAADIPFTSARSSAAGASTWPPHFPRPRTFVHFSSVLRPLLDCLGVFAKGADQLLDRLGGLALDDATGRARRQALELDHREHGRLGRHPHVRGLHFLDLLLLGAHDALERGIARLVEPLLRGGHRGQREVEDLEPAFHLAPHPDGLAVRVDRLLHDPGRHRPAQQLGHLRGHRAHVVVDGLATEEREPGRLLLDHRRERARGHQGVGRVPHRVL